MNERIFDLMRSECSFLVIWLESCLSGTIFGTPPPINPYHSECCRAVGLFYSTGPGILVKEKMLEGNLTQFIILFLFPIAAQTSLQK